MTSRPTSRIVLSSLTTLAALLSGASLLHALPPLGLTQISPSTTATSGLEIIDGTAYLNSGAGLWKLDASGIPEQLSAGDNLTKVVKAVDNRLYVANKTGAGLYRLDPALTFVHQYGYLFMGSPGDDPEPLGTLIDIDSSLRAYGWFGNAARFDMDANIENYSSPGECCWDLVESTPSGYALGWGTWYDSIGSAPMLWNPDGTFNSYPFSLGDPSSVRERLDGNGVNVGARDGGLRYGPTYPLLTSSGTSWTFEDVLVSHSNFTVISGIGSEFFGFFPGIDPDHPGRPVPLLDIFPQLATIDIDAITSAASVDGYLYLTINGSDGLYLFGAPDPSLIPEPATWALLLSLVVPLALRRA